MDRANRVRTTRRYTLLSSVFAFILWGGWAFHINAGHGEVVQLMALLTQGSASFVITLIMARSVAILFSRIQNDWIRAILPAVATVSFTGSALVSIHHWVGTPEVAATVSPALSIAFLYCLYTTYTLQQRMNDQQGEQQ